MLKIALMNLDKGRLREFFGYRKNPNITKVKIDTKENIPQIIS